MAEQPSVQNTSAPANIEMAYGYNVFTLTDSNNTNPRFVLQIWTWDDLTASAGQLLFDLRQQSNLAGVTHFDVQKILQNNVEFQYAFAPDQRWFNTNEFKFNELPNSFVYAVKWGFENAAGVPVVQGEAGPYQVYAGRKLYDEITFDITPFRPSFNPGSLGQITLTQSARPFTQTWDAYPLDTSGALPYKTVRVTNGQNCYIPVLTSVNVNYDPDPEINTYVPYAELEGFDADGTQLFLETIDADLAMGAECFTTLEPEYYEAHKSIITFNPGLDSLKSTYPDLQTLEVRTGVYYYQTGLATCIKAAGDRNVYGAWRFVYDANECNDYDETVLTWQNKWGFQEFFSFQKEKTRNLSYDRQEYYQAGATWNQATFDHPTHAPGSRVFAQSQEEEWTLRTRWLTANEVLLMESLLKSGWCSVYESARNLIPATILTNRYVERNERRQKMYQFEITIKLANNEQLQRG